MNLILLAITSIREGYENGNVSEPSLEYFQTQPDAPDPQNITITLDTDLEVGEEEYVSSSMTRAANMSWPELEGHQNYFCSNYTNLDNSITIGPTCIKAGTQDPVFKMKNLLPGAKYEVCFESLEKFFRYNFHR